MPQPQLTALLDRTDTELRADHKAGGSVDCYDDCDTHDATALAHMVIDLHNAQHPSVARWCDHAACRRAAQLVT